jgi:hypothetical protein
MDTGREIKQVTHQQGECDQSQDGQGRTSCGPGYRKGKEGKE